jgi:hypothetical protein
VKKVCVNVCVCVRARARLRARTREGANRYTIHSGEHMRASECTSCEQENEMEQAKHLDGSPSVLATSLDVHARSCDKVVVVPVELPCLLHLLISETTPSYRHGAGVSGCQNRRNRRLKVAAEVDG